MFYFKAKEEFTKHSLVPFTAPLDVHINNFGANTWTGDIYCNGRRVVHYRYIDKMCKDGPARRHVEDVMGTIVTYVNEYIENAIEDGEIEGIIDLDVYKEDITANER